MTKKELRKKYKALRAAISTEQIEEYSIDIANQLLQLDIWHHQFYHLFLSITKQNEVQTDYILNILSGKDKHCVVAKSDFETLSMSHYLLSDDTRLEVNSYGIPEPKNGIPIDTKMIDVVFIPLLAYDTKGHRIGYGKGFYDRFLQQCKPETLKIGLSFFEAETSSIPDEHTDISLDFCVHPKGIYQF